MKRFERSFSIGRLNRDVSSRSLARYKDLDRFTNLGEFKGLPYTVSFEVFHSLSEYEFERSFSIGRLNRDVSSRSLAR